MPAIPDDQRIAGLCRFGLSEPLIRLSCGEVVHELFRHSCLGPPYFVYHGAGAPQGPPLIPMWDSGNTVVGVWEQADGPEFIEYDIEADDQYWPLARSEQGFWATRFDFYYACDVPLEELRAAAEIIGFRFLDQYLSAREAAENSLSTFESHRAWLRGVVSDIDRESRGT